MIVTTTNSVENANITKYIELIATNVVVGTNVFSDLKASITDIFGGSSQTYQKKLQQIYKTAISNLQTKAYEIGANAIIGLKIDFDEISGGNKSMLMISAVGMAVYVKFATDENLNEFGNETVSANQLENEIYRRTIISNISENILPDQNQWNYLLNNPIYEITPNLIKQYILLKKTQLDLYSTNQRLIGENFIDYIYSANNDIAVDALYSNITSNFSIVYEVLNICRLYSPLNVLELTDKRLDIAIACLNLQKSSYSKEDLILMKKTLEKLDSLPDTGSIGIAKDGILSKEKERFICQCGHKNDADRQYCSKCGSDIKGLNEKQRKLIENFKLTVESLECLITN